MTTANKRFVQKAIAVVIIVTLLYGAGVAPVVMMFVSGLILIVFLVSRKTQNREVERLFNFYVAAEAILREEDRRWYGFEVAEVIENGELVLETMPDPPPLLLFTLGALHHLIGNVGTSADYLSHVMEDEHFDERHRTAPSGQLRRYVTLLRKIEAEPAFAPQTLGAVRSLERMRKRQALKLLSESRLALTLSDNSAAPNVNKAAAEVENKPASPAYSGPLTAPPPIRDLLHDIYQDENGPSH